MFTSLVVIQLINMNAISRYYKSKNAWYSHYNLHDVNKVL